MLTYEENCGEPWIRDSFFLNAEKGGMKKREKEFMRMDGAVPSLYSDRMRPVGNAEITICRAERRFKKHDGWDCLRPGARVGGSNGKKESGNLFFPLKS